MFEITTPTEATLKSVAPRTEKHGDEDVVAVSLGLKITGPNTLLDTVQPGLLDTLYVSPPGQESLPGVEPARQLLRTAGIEQVDLKACFEGWTLKIDAGIDGDTDPIAIGGAKVDRFAVVPAQGGTIELHFRVGSNDVSAEEMGWLCSHLKQGITIELTAPKKLDTIDGSVEAFQRDHPGAAGADDRQADLLDAGDATDAFVERHAGDFGDGAADEGDEVAPEAAEEPAAPRRRSRKAAAAAVE
jgi:hypothetical protein